MAETFGVSAAIGVARLVWDALRGGWQFARRNKRKLSDAQVIELRQKWKPLFEAHLLDCYRKGLRHEIIIRDMRRIDNYPQTKEKRRGISSWFRVGLADTYHRGFMVGMRIGMLTKDRTGEWRYTNRKAAEAGDVKAYMIGYIPYENVESVDWDGDEYYSWPHVYCHFVEKHRQPYERIAFCERWDFDGRDHYREIADLEPVHRLSRKRGSIDDFG